MDTDDQALLDQTEGRLTLVNLNRNDLSFRGLSPDCKAKNKEEPLNVHQMHHHMIRN